jgi:hypothetical protein
LENLLISQMASAAHSVVDPDPFNFQSYLLPWNILEVHLRLRGAPTPVKHSYTYKLHLRGTATGGTTYDIPYIYSYEVHLQLRGTVHLQLRGTVHLQLRGICTPTRYIYTYEVHLHLRGKAAPTGVHLYLLTKTT